MSKRKADLEHDRDQIKKQKSLVAVDSLERNENILSSMQILPSEIMTIILSYCNRKNHLRLVCHWWFELINYSHFNVGLVLNSEVDEFIKCFNRYNRPISLTLQKDEDNSFLVHTSVSKLTALTNLTSLDIRCKRGCVAFRRLTNLRSLNTKALNQFDLEKLTNLTKLKFRQEIIVRDNTTKIALPTTLVSLQFAGLDLDKYPQTDPRSLLHPLPRVTSLHIYSGHEYILHYTSNVQKLIMRKKTKFPDGLFLPSLYELECYGSTSVPHYQQTTLTKLMTFGGCFHMEWDTKALANLKEFTIDYGSNYNIGPLTNLQALDLTFTDWKVLQDIAFPEKMTRLQLGLSERPAPDLTPFTNLIDLQLRPTRLAKPTYISTFYQLTRLVITGAMNFTACLSALTKLQDLTIYAADGKDSVYSLDLRPLTGLRKLHLEVEDSDFLTGVELEGLKLAGLTLLQRLRSDHVIQLQVNGLSSLTRLTSLWSAYGWCYNWLNYSDLVQLTTLRNLQADISDEEDLTLLSRLCHLTSVNIAHEVKQAHRLTCMTSLQSLKFTIARNEIEQRDECKKVLRAKLPLLFNLECYVPRHLLYK